MSPPQVLKRCLLTLCLVTFFHCGIGGKECRVYAGLGKPCIFPYRLNGEFFAECTTKFDKFSDEPMCPTRLEDEKTLEASRSHEDWGKCSKDCDLQQYNSNEQIFDKIEEFADKYREFAEVFSIGLSKKGQPLKGLRISKNVRKDRETLKPMVRLIGNIHGNEAVGREVLLHLAKHLIVGYAMVFASKHMYL